MRSIKLSYLLYLLTHLLSSLGLENAGFDSNQGLINLFFYSIIVSLFPDANPSLIAIEVIYSAYWDIIADSRREREVRANAVTRNRTYS